MEILPQLDNDEETIPSRRFRITWIGWLLFAALLAFCLLWPPANGLPLISLAWGIYPMAACLAAAASLLLAWIVYRLAGRSVTLANIVFAALQIAAFAVAATAMMTQAENQRHGTLRFDAFPPDDTDTTATVQSMSSLARQAEALAQTPPGSGNPAQVGEMVGRLDAAARSEESTGAQILVQTIRLVQDDKNQLQQAFVAFQKTGGLDLSTVDSAASLRRRAQLASQLEQVTSRSLEFVDTLPADLRRRLEEGGLPQRSADWMLQQFATRFRSPEQILFRQALLRYAGTAVTLFDFLQDHWGRWHFDKTADAVVLAPAMSQEQVAAYDEMAEQVVETEQQLDQAGHALSAATRAPP